MINLEDKKVLVTGANGFVGRSVCKVLEKRKSTVIRGSRNRWDLTSPDDVYYMLHDMKPDYVIHLGANTGGIVYNKNHPADLFHDNILMTTNLLKVCHEMNIDKVVNVTTSCSYPDGLSLLKEEDYWNGKPNPSVEFFGIAKRAGEAYGRALNKQHGTNIVSVCVTNLYGPNDNFTENGKVVSNLIRKFLKAKEDNTPEVVCLGTGNPMRELMFVSDAAEGIIRALEYYNDPNLPLNIGTGSDISIKALAEKISFIVGYKGKITWNILAGDGQMKKLLDVTRMKNIIGYEPETSLEEGLKETIEWYLKHKV